MPIELRSGERGAPATPWMHAFFQKRYDLRDLQGIFNVSIGTPRKIARLDKLAKLVQVLVSWELGTVFDLLLSRNAWRKTSDVSRAHAFSELAIITPDAENRHGDQNVFERFFAELLARST